MPLYFITSNKFKFQEAQAIIPSLVQLDIDLPEIQSLDPHEIIETKLESAKQYHDGEFIVSDTSLYFDALNGLPGPLIKWFCDSVGNDGLYQLCVGSDNYSAIAQVVVGHISVGGVVSLFEGLTKGTIVAPRGKHGWGWDPIFQPVGLDKTFAELESDEKSEFCMRRVAFEKLREFLTQSE